MLLALSVALVSFGCEGDTGPQGDQGPQGPQGEQGPPGTPGSGVSEFAFQGDFGSACLHCHATLTNEYVTTNHRFAYEDLAAIGEETNNFCLQCHTTGFNCDVDQATGEIDEASCVEPDDGYSGYIGDDTEEGAARRAALEGVQCESCHGAMGPDFNAHVPEISFSTWDNSLCAGCHDFQIEEWKTSGHALSEGGDAELLTEHFGRSSCNPCHTSEGYIQANDPSYADYDFGELYSHIGCPTCHDPHVGENGGGNEAQLRNVDQVVLSYTFPADPDEDDNFDAWTVDGYGAGQTCMQCHKARRDNSNVAGQIASGSAHFGPHGSPQADMFWGRGSYEIPDLDYSANRGDTGNTEHPHQSFADGCVTCHMAFDDQPAGGAAPEGHVVHNFEQDLEACTGCHGALDEAGLAALQQPTRDLLDEFAQLLGYVDAQDLADNINDSETGNRTWPQWQREAAYGFIFVWNSGSFGAHNSYYAEVLLNNAIAYAEANLAP
jgi:hypothetical protein